MTRDIKCSFVAAAILGLGCGGYLGYFEANQTSDTLKSIQYIGPTRSVSDFARKQFMHADTDHARQAVILQIRLLEQLELADKSFHADELAFAYIRLATIEEAAGRTDGEQLALLQARARWKPHPRDKEVTDDDLKNALRRSDKLVDNH